MIFIQNLHIELFSNYGMSPGPQVTDVRSDGNSTHTCTACIVCLDLVQMQTPGTLPDRPFADLLVHVVLVVGSGADVSGVHVGRDLGFAEKNAHAAR